MNSPLERGGNGLVRVRRFGVVAIFLLGVLWRSAGADPDFPTSWDYHLNQIMGELELRGKIGILDGVSPYSVGDVFSATKSAGMWHDFVLSAVYPFTEREDLFVLWTPGVWGRYRSWTGKTDTFGRMRFGLGGTFRNWSIVGIYRLDSGYYSDPDYYGIRWERIAGKADQVYVRWSGERAYIQIGKDYLRVAEGMALSGEKPYERAQFFLRLGKHFSLLWFVGQLDEYVEFADTERIIYNRYLAGHRAQLKWKNFEVGFTELMLFGGVGRQIEFYYLLPFYAFHGEQLNHRWDDNTLWSLDVKGVVPPVRVEFEGILDDFQIEHESAADREPPEVGFKGKVDVALLSKPFFLTQSVSYEGVTAYTFNQPHPWNRYLYENKPLGTPYGNDYDRWSLTTDFLFGRGGATVELYRMRRGEARIDDPWTSPWMDDPNWKLKFPSGVVEKVNGVSLYGWGSLANWRLWKIKGQILGDISIDYHHSVNFDNQPGVEVSRYEIKASVEFKMGYCGF